jgi:hypothetical protein
MFGTFKNRERRSPKKRRRFQPRLETLEDRTVPTTILTGVDMSTMAATIGGYPPAGPTHLYLNFEGGGVIASAGLSDQQIQDTLYRTSEIYAPFNVEVSRLYGSGTADTSGDGSTTVFVGNNTTTAGYSFTPPENSDYPHVTTLFTHRPNSDGNDVAYVASGAPAGTARGVAHEAGHTFGLVHVRTDVDLFSGTFNTDPMPLGGLGTVPDIMSYTGGNNYFKDQSLPITNFNNGGSGVPTIEPSFTPFYMDDLSSPTLEIAPSTQNSYAYLQTVLGERPA